jgi:hypothetical protein
VPTSPITGIAGVDSLLWYAAIATGQQQLPIFNTWFQPGPLAALGSVSGYPFSTSPGIIDPDGKVYPLFGIPGTDGPQNLMPWHDVTFQLDPIRPFVAYFNHLMADPADNPIQLPSLVEVGRSVQALLASLFMVFDPFTPGSPVCAGRCSFVTDQHLDIPDIVRSIGKLWPGNDTIDTWLAAYDSGTANVPTQEIIDRSVKILQQGFWSFGNPSPLPELSTGFNFSTLAPQFHALWTALGFNPPPLNTDNTESLVASTAAPGPLRAAKEVPQSLPQAVSTEPADPAGTAGSSGSVLNAAVNPPADVPGSGAATLPAQGGGLTPPTPSNDSATIHRTRPV